LNGNSATGLTGDTPGFHGEFAASNRGRTFLDIKHVFSFVESHQEYGTEKMLRNEKDKMGRFGKRGTVYFLPRQSRKPEKVKLSPFYQSPFYPMID